MNFRSELPSGAKSYLFVDGASFRNAISEISKYFFEGESLQVDWRNLRAAHHKVFYYDAIPTQEQDEDASCYSRRISPKVEELSLIERQSGFHVKTGDVRKRRNRGNEQKMVDVQLAVDALQAASRGLFSHCTLVTGDLDFRPLVEAFVDMGIDVTVDYPPGHTNSDLLSAADHSVPLTLNNAEEYLTLTDDQRAFVPRAFSDFQRQEPRPENVILEWEDPEHGRCFIAPHKDKIRLVTERCPYNPKTHRLVLKAQKLQHLRYYAEVHREIRIPDLA